MSSAKEFGFLCFFFACLLCVHFSRTILNVAAVEDDDGGAIPDEVTPPAGNPGGLRGEAPNLPDEEPEFSSGASTPPPLPTPFAPPAPSDLPTPEPSLPPPALPPNGTLPLLGELEKNNNEDNSNKETKVNLVTPAPPPVQKDYTNDPTFRIIATAMEGLATNISAEEIKQTMEDTTLTEAEKVSVLEIFQQVMSNKPMKYEAFLSYFDKLPAVVGEHVTYQLVGHLENYQQVVDAIHFLPDRFVHSIPPEVYEVIPDHVLLSLPANKLAVLPKETLARLPSKNESQVPEEVTAKNDAFSRSSNSYFTIAAALFVTCAVLLF